MLSFSLLGSRTAARPPPAQRLVFVFEPDDAIFTALNLAFVVLFALLVRIWTDYELVPGVMTHTVGPCDLEGTAVGRHS